MSRSYIRECAQCVHLVYPYVVAINRLQLPRISFRGAHELWRIAIHRPTVYVIVQWPFPYVVISVMELKPTYSVVADDR